MDPPATRSSAPSPGPGPREDASPRGEPRPQAARVFLLESDPDGILHQGADRLAAALGLQSRLFANRPFYERMPPASRALLLKHWPGAEPSTPARDLACAFLDAAGHPQPFSILLFPLRRGDGAVAGVRIIASDMAVQHNLAHALEASEERFGTLFREASDPILILSLEGEILSVNNAFEASTGLRSEQLFRAEKHWEDFVLDQDLPGLHQTIDRCRREQASGSCELRLMRADGDAVWFEQRLSLLHDAVGQPKGFLALCRNVQARKELELALREEAEVMQVRNLRAQALIGHLKAFFTETSALPADLGGFLEGICGILYRMYTPSMVLVQTLGGRQVVRAADGLQLPRSPDGRLLGIPTAMCRRVLATGNPFLSNHLQDDPTTSGDMLVRALGLLTFFCLPLRDVSGAIQGTIALADQAARSPDSVDVELITVASLQIAARLRAEEHEQARRELEAHLRQSQKMQALGMLAGGIAHDFNNILSGILGFSSNLVEQCAPGTPFYEDVKLIETSAQRAAQLTSQLLAFARRRNFPREALSLNAVVDETLGILRRSLGKNVRLQTSLDRDLPELFGDAGQIGQVVMNLCLNAAEAMAGTGGTLSIATGRGVSPKHRSRLNLYDEAGAEAFLHLRIADSGIGMSEEIRNHLFDPFFTTKSGTGGSGLGLAIVYGIVNNHGGDVIVESTEGRGATFHIYLPLRAGEDAAGTAPRAGDVGGTETILFIDDEPVVRQVVSRILAPRGYTVMTLPSGDAAIEQYVDWHGQVDLVLLDMVMPGSDGEATFRALQQRDPDLPILLTSGFAQPETTDRLLAAGARGLLYKPFRSETLLAQIRRTLDSAHPLP